MQTKILHDLNLSISWTNCDDVFCSYRKMSLAQNSKSFGFYYFIIIQCPLCPEGPALGFLQAFSVSAARSFADRRASTERHLHLSSAADPVSLEAPCLLSFPAAYKLKRRLSCLSSSFPSCHPFPPSVVLFQRPCSET